MEIPGLHHLKSQDLSPEVGENGIETPDTKTAKTVPATKPLIDAALEARIAAMRAQIREKGDNLLQAPSSSATSEVVQTQAPASSVNYSILDHALASHGFETMPDSDEDNDVTMETSTSASDSSSSVSTDDSDDDSEDDGPMSAGDREKILHDIDYDEPLSSEIPRTKNEINEEEEAVVTPDFVISDTEPIEPLGTITSIVGRACVVTGAPSSPETRVLDIGSLLVFEDRKNIGYIADTFGPVILPMFTVKFRCAEDLEAAGVVVGTVAYVVPKHANYVFNDTLRVKGTDASNLHDEEQSETEFSDDEAEALYKSQKKQQRRANKSGGANAVREPRPLNDLESIALAQGLTYNASTSQMRPQATTYQRSDGEHGNSRRGSHGGTRARGRGRGRPETNNFGRGPASQDNLPQMTDVQSVRQSFQRPFYQPSSTEQTGTPTESDGSLRTLLNEDKSITPMLYQPLKRPN